MRLATRTGLAAFLAAVAGVLVLTGVVTSQFERILRERVDQQLEDRAATAPILVAIGERISISELNPTIDATRVLLRGNTLNLGRLPTDPLPPVGPLGFRTAQADGEEWRLFGVPVSNLPAVGDEAIVELAEPLGDVEASVRRARQRVSVGGLIAAVVAGLAGLGFGRRAISPLTRLRGDVAELDGGNGQAWSVAESYGNPEVDEIAEALNSTLADVGEANERREAALTTARAFAASATHELRTPLQSAMTNLDIAASESSSPHQTSARADLDRMASALEAVRSFTDADLIDPSWFELVDLADLVEQAVAAESSNAVDTEFTIVGSHSAELRLWPDGVLLALGNLLRNAATHGRPRDGSPCRIVVTVDSEQRCVTVDDNGPGIDDATRARVVAPFVRGDTHIPGSGLGLAFVERVASAHGGEFTIDRAPATEGTRATLVLAPPQPL